MGFFGASRDGSGVIDVCTKCRKKKSIYTRTGMCESCAKEKTKIEETIATLQGMVESAKKHSETRPESNEIAKDLMKQIAGLERDLSKFPTKDISPKPRF